MSDLSNYSYEEIVSGLERFLGDDSANIFKGPYIFHDDEIYLVQYAGKVSYTYQRLYTVAYRKDVTKTVKHEYIPSGGSYTGTIDSLGNVTLHEATCETYYTEEKLYNIIYRRSLLTEYGEAIKLCFKIRNWNEEIREYLSNLPKKEFSFNREIKEDFDYLLGLENNDTFGIQIVPTLKECFAIIGLAKKYKVKLSKYTSNSKWRCPREVQMGKDDLDERIAYLVKEAERDTIVKIDLDEAVYYRTKKKNFWPLVFVFGLAFIAVAVGFAVENHMNKLAIFATLFTYLGFPLFGLSVLFLVLSLVGRKKNGKYILDVLKKYR